MGSAWQPRCVREVETNLWWIKVTGPCWVTAQEQCWRVASPQPLPCCTRTPAGMWLCAQNLLPAATTLPSPTLVTGSLSVCVCSGVFVFCLSRFQGTFVRDAGGHVTQPPQTTDRGTLRAGKTLGTITATQHVGGSAGVESRHPALSRMHSAPHHSTMFFVDFLPGSL